MSWKSLLKDDESEDGTYWKDPSEDKGRKELELLKMLKINLDSYLKDSTKIIDVVGRRRVDSWTQHPDLRSRNNIYSIIDDLLLLKR